MTMVRVCAWLAFVAGGISVFAALGAGEVFFLMSAINAIVAGILLLALDQIILLLSRIADGVAPQAASTLQTPHAAELSQPGAHRSIAEIEADIARLANRPR